MPPGLSIFNSRRFRHHVTRLVTYPLCSLFEGAALPHNISDDIKTHHFFYDDGDPQNSSKDPTAYGTVGTGVLL